MSKKSDKERARLYGLALATAKILAELRTEGKSSPADPTPEIALGMILCTRLGLKCRPRSARRRGGAGMPKKTN